MTEAEMIIQRAKEIRNRLRRPPNAVKDRGIDLKRNKRLDASDLAKMMVKEHPTFAAVVHIVSLSPKELHRRNLTLPEILRAVSNHYEIPVSILLGQSRFYHITLPRFVIYYLARKHLKHNSYMEIGLKLKRNHTTIMSGANIMREKLLVDQDLCMTVYKLESDLFAGIYERKSDTRAHHPNRPVATERQSDMAGGEVEQGVQESTLYGVDQGSGLADQDAIERIQEDHPAV